MKFFQTKCIELASSIIASGFPLYSIELAEGKTLFFFRREKSLDLVVSRYWLGETRVEPQILLKEYQGLLESISSRS